MTITMPEQLCEIHRRGRFDSPTTNGVTPIAPRSATPDNAKARAVRADIAGHPAITLFRTAMSNAHPASTANPTRKTKQLAILENDLVKRRSVGVVICQSPSATAWVPQKSEASGREPDPHGSYQKRRRYLTAHQDA